MATGHGPISGFIDRHFRHFNAAALKDATDAYIAHLDGGGKMLVTLAGAMSTAELGISLAEMIRQGKVHAICCTGANLEEDVFNLVAHAHYERVPHYRDLTPPRRAGAARPAPEPRHRHVHSRRRGDAPHRVDRARRLDRRRQEGRAPVPARVHVPDPALEAARAVLPDRSRRTAGCWRPRRRTCRSSCRAGRTRRSATSSRRTASTAASSRRRR